VKAENVIEHLSVGGEPFDRSTARASPAAL
jgi:hypothetical protein